MRQFLCAFCLLLACGSALALRTLAGDEAELPFNVVEATFDNTGSYGEGQGRGLLATYDSTTVEAKGKFVIRPSERGCGGFFRIAEEGYLQGVAELAQTVAGICTVPVPDPEVDDVKITFTCRKRIDTNRAVVRVSVISFSIDDDTKRACYEQEFNKILSEGTASCAVKKHLTKQAAKWWSPLKPFNTC